MNRFMFAMVLAVAVSCGLSNQPTALPVDKTTEALCSDAPRINADGTATQVGCAFEQHVENVIHHGESLAAGATLRDERGVSVQASNLCGDWVLAVDAQGVQILVRQSTAQVQSHGQLHPGFPQSTLPAELAAPLTIR